jgi:hypothetical protein
MTEMQLQLYWLNHATNFAELRDVNGFPIEVITPGIINFDQGPDFLFGNIKIDSIEWIGSIEIHQKTSQWFSHQHQEDPQYQKVILHVVWENDLRSFNQCAVLELSKYISLDSFSDVSNCIEKFQPDLSYPGIDLLERLAIERMEERANALLVELKHQKGDWNAVFWKKVGYTLGLPLNGTMFERFIDAIYKINNTSLSRSSIDVNSLLMSMAGYSDLLSMEENEHSNRLLSKYGLNTLPTNLVRFRTRPSNFPLRRLAQLSEMIISATDLFRSVIDENDLKLLNARFPSTISKLMADRLMINVFVPTLLAYSKYTGVLSHRFKAMEWLETCAPEDNKFTRAFTKEFFRPTSAIQTQGIIVWYKTLNNK